MKGACIFHRRNRIAPSTRQNASSFQVPLVNLSVATYRMDAIAKHPGKVGAKDIYQRHLARKALGNLIFFCVHQIVCNPKHKRRKSRIALPSGQGQILVKSAIEEQKMRTFSLSAPADERL